MIDHFKSFLVNENKFYLGQRSGDILTALQNLQDDSSGMGERALSRSCQNLVNQIRRILHGRWNEEDMKYLKVLQKVAVAITKAIEEDGDIKEIVASAVTEVQGMLDDLQIPINSLGTEDVEIENQPGEMDTDEPIKRGSEFST